jgi:hypothetical protein
MDNDMAAPRREDREKQNRAPTTTKQAGPFIGLWLFGGCRGSVLFFSVFPLGEAFGIVIDDIPYGLVDGVFYTYKYPDRPLNEATSWEEQGVQNRAPSSTNQPEPNDGFRLVGA